MFDVLDCQTSEMSWSIRRSQSTSDGKGDIGLANNLGTPSERLVEEMNQLFS